VEGWKGITGRESSAEMLMPEIRDTQMVNTLEEDSSIHRSKRKKGRDPGSTPRLSIFVGFAGKAATGRKKPDPEKQTVETKRRCGGGEGQQIRKW